ncbi:futalosine hydrolase [Streptomyces sp. NPDC058653]|uniref:futalosine hydrolase n=1 Tax=Streptomyces sp. NPDC058653 TaxID=3346576 RepID=UPI00364A379D
MRVLVVTAVRAEADAVCGGLGAVTDMPVPNTTDATDTAGERRLPGGYVLTSRPGADVLAAGVGPAAVASGTATALARAELSSAPYDLVVSAGIGGGFRPHAPVGSLVVADAIVAADLGAETPEGFLPVDELGFGRTVHRPPPELSTRIARLLDAVHAPVLTVSTVTGSAARTAELTARHPRAAAEAMEGFGVAEAAAAYGVPVVEIRAVSNAVGPRDRSAWRIGQALEALRYACGQLSPVFEESP